MNLRALALIAVFGAVVLTIAPAYAEGTDGKLILLAEQQPKTTSAGSAEQTTEIRPGTDASARSERLKLDAEAEVKKPAREKAPPLPFHTIEGYGGGAITPIAYLVNPGPKGTIIGLPAASFTYINLREKDLEALAVTETLFRRVELGYALDRFGLGSLPHDIQWRTGVDIDSSQVFMHNFNVRTLLLEEDSFGLPLPAFTAGVHFKINDGIQSINDRLGGGLTKIGYRHADGTEFTFVGTKMIPKVFGRPLILSAGFRESSAAWTGYLGFSNRWATTFETNVVYLPTDWLALAYEFRNNADPYDTIPGLIGITSNWNCFHVAFIINKHCTVDIGYGLLGNMANTTENSALAFQFKYEF